MFQEHQQTRVEDDWIPEQAMLMVLIDVHETAINNNSFSIWVSIEKIIARKKAKDDQVRVVLQAKLLEHQ